MEQKEGLSKESIQYNHQDLDQEQRMDVNPLQLNTQNIHIHVRNNINNYCGKITGTTYQGKSKDIVPNATIFLFFGSECKQPVYKARTIMETLLLKNCPPVITPYLPNTNQF